MSDIGNVARGTSSFSLPPPEPGFWGNLWSGIGEVAKGVIPALQFGTGALGLYSGIRGATQLAGQTKAVERGQRIQSQMARETSEAAAPLRAFGTDVLTAAAAGRLPAPIEGQIQNWIAGAKQKMRDYLARIGQGDSQTLQQIESEIERQAQDMRATALAQQEQVGIAALTSGAGATATAAGVGGSMANVAAQQQASLEQLIAQANQTLAQITGGRA